MNVISDSPTITTTAYAAGDAVGGLLTFKGVDPRGLLHSVSVTDADQVAKAMDLVVFHQPFSPTADNAAFTVSSSDQGKLVAVISIAQAQYAHLGNVSMAVINQLGVPFVCPDENAQLYGQLVARDAMTFTNSDALRVSIGVLADGGF